MYRFVSSIGAHRYRAIPNRSHAFCYKVNQLRPDIACRFERKFFYRPSCDLRRTVCPGNLVGDVIHSNKEQVLNEVASLLEATYCDAAYQARGRVLSQDDSTDAWRFAGRGNWGAVFEFVGHSNHPLSGMALKVPCVRNPGKEYREWTAPGYANANIREIHAAMAKLADEASAAEKIASCGLDDSSAGVLRPLAHIVFDNPLTPAEEKTKMGNQNAFLMPYLPRSEYITLEKVLVSDTKHVGSPEAASVSEDVHVDRRGRDIVEEIRSDRLRDPAKFAATVLRQLLITISVLEKYGIMHQDIKPQNIEYSGIGKPIKLVDIALLDWWNPKEHGAEGKFDRCTYEYIPPIKTSLFDLFDCARCPKDEVFAAALAAAECALLNFDAPFSSLEGGVLWGFGPQHHADISAVNAERSFLERAKDGVMLDATDGLKYDMYRNLMRGLKGEFGISSQEGSSKKAPQCWKSSESKKQDYYVVLKILFGRLTLEANFPDMDERSMDLAARRELVLSLRRKLLMKVAFGGSPFKTQMPLPFTFLQFGDADRALGICSNREAFLNGLTESMVGERDKRLQLRAFVENVIFPMLALDKSRRPGAKEALVLLDDWTK